MVEFVSFISVGLSICGAVVTGRQTRVFAQNYEEDAVYGLSFGLSSARPLI